VRGPNRRRRLVGDSEIVGTIVDLRRHYHFGPPQDRHVLPHSGRADESRGG